MLRWFNLVLMEWRDLKGTRQLDPEDRERVNYNLNLLAYTFGRTEAPSIKTEFIRRGGVAFTEKGSSVWDFPIWRYL